MELLYTSSLTSLTSIRLIDTDRRPIDVGPAVWSYVVTESDIKVNLYSDKEKATENGKAELGSTVPR